MVEKKLLEVGGEDVPQCPIAGDANGGPINDIMLRGCAVYTGWVKKSKLLILSEYVNKIGKIGGM